MDTATAKRMRSTPRSPTVTAFDVRRRRQLELHRRIINDAKPVLLAALDGFGVDHLFRHLSRRERIERAMCLLQEALHETPGRWSDGVTYADEAAAQLLMAHAASQLDSNENHVDSGNDDADLYPTL